MGKPLLMIYIQIRMYPHFLDCIANLFVAISRYYHLLWLINHWFDFKL